MRDIQATVTQLGTGDAGHWRMLTANLPGPDGSVPLTVLDVRPEMAVRTGPDERVTSTVAALLGMGLPPVTTINEQLATAIDGRTSQAPWDLPETTGWRFELTSLRVARLTAPDGSVIWNRDFDQPIPWREQITSTKRCVLLIGAVGLYPTAERGYVPIPTLLNQAAQAGELVGGLVAAGGS